MLVIWVSLLDWRTKRDTPTRSGTNAGNVGRREDSDAARGRGGSMPAGTGPGRMSMRRWRGSACSNDEMKERAVGPAADSASHDDVDPRCRHDTPLSIAHSS